MSFLESPTGLGVFNSFENDFSGVLYSDDPRSLVCAAELRQAHRDSEGQFPVYSPSESNGASLMMPKTSSIMPETHYHNWFTPFGCTIYSKKRKYFIANFSRMALSISGRCVSR